MHEVAETATGALSVTKKNIFTLNLDCCIKLVTQMPNQQNPIFPLTQRADQAAQNPLGLVNPKIRSCK